MTMDALLKAVREAKKLYDHGAFGALAQAEFFKQVESAFSDVKPSEAKEALKTAIAEETKEAPPPVKPTPQTVVKAVPKPRS